MSDVTVAVIYHSGHGHTAKQAEAVAEGVRHDGAQALLLAVGPNFKDWANIETANGIIFGAPTYMGARPRSSKPLRTQPRTRSMRPAGSGMTRSRPASPTRERGAATSQRRCISLWPLRTSTPCIGPVSSSRRQTIRRRAQHLFQLGAPH